MTFSIAELCQRTGQLGCAVATSSMAVGARVGRVRAGQAVALSQACTDPRLHEVGLAAVADGKTARDAVAAMREAAVQPHWRQFSILRADGSLAFHTGDQCVAHTGEQGGQRCLALGNALRNDDVVPAMVMGFEQAEDDEFAARLLKALESGLTAGGETDPLRSASLLIYGEHSFALADLRVDDDPAPIARLRELWTEWAPKAEGYAVRILDPDNAPSSTDLEAR